MSDAPFAIFMMFLGFCFFVATARLIGWAMGISEIRKKSEILIQQNNQILDELEKLVTISKANAEKNGVKFKS